MSQLKKASWASCLFFIFYKVAQCSVTRADQRATKGSTFPRSTKERPSKQQSNTGESTLQLYIYFVPFHPRFSKVWSRLFFLGRFSSQYYMKTFSFLLRNGLEAPGQWFTAVWYKRCDSELLPISSQECLLHWRKWNALLLRWFPASSPLPLPASCLWSQEVKITTMALLWSSAFSNSSHCFFLNPEAALQCLPPFHSS